MNHVYGNGEASPAEDYDKQFSPYRMKAKNELKNTLFINIKHLIDSMTEESRGRIERYVNNYCNIENVTQADKQEVKEMFKTKLKTI